MNIAVVGGAGFVGSALVKRLLKDGHTVTVFDNCSRGQEDNIPSTAFLVRMDARDMHYIGEAYDWVYDLAARVYGVRDLYKNPGELLSDNIAITTAILKAAVRSKVPNYLYVSSSCVYDFPGAVVPHTETDTNICDTSYGFSKVAGEQLVKWYAAQFGFVAKIARLFNVYGPGDSFQSPHVIPEFIRKAEAVSRGDTNVFPILGLGNQTRDFTYMDDVVAGIQTIASAGQSGEAYNIGTGREVSIRDLAEIVCRQMDLAYPAFAYEGVAKEDIQRRAADNRKLRALGWEPKVTLEEGIARLVRVPATA